MIKFSLFPTLAAVLCIASLFSCTSHTLSDDQSSSSVNLSSSSVEVSSSSVQISSSSFSVNSSSSSVAVSSSSVQISSSSSIATNDPNLVKKSITLSFSGSSYADIDGNVNTYTQAIAASIPNKIDLIAYCGTTMWCEHNSIYSPWEIGLFWTDYDDFLGSEEVFFLEIPSAQAEVFKTATKLSQIESTYNDLTDLFDDTDNYLDEIPIAIGKVFFVYTSEENIRIVIIKATGNQSVDLEIIQIPGY